MGRTECKKEKKIIMKNCECTAVEDCTCGNFIINK